MALIPLISFEVVLNIYLTSLFLHPLRRMCITILSTHTYLLVLELYSYKNGTNGALRVMVSLHVHISTILFDASSGHKNILWLLRYTCFKCHKYACSYYSGRRARLDLFDAMQPGRYDTPTDLLPKPSLTVPIVLFSVLVLHWVTSVDRDLDNSSHGTLRSHPVFDLQRNMSRGKAEFSSTERKAGVTTNIEANGNDHYDEIALDAIAVKTSQTQEVEVRGHTSRSDEFNHSDYEVERSGSQDAIVHAENVV